jgi:hypothetical protein
VDLRLYREEHLAKGLSSFTVTFKETDLWIAAKRDLSKEAFKVVRRIRTELDEFISKYPSFLHSLSPIEMPKDAPPIVLKMAEASRKVGVGPMASVAGAFAEAVGKELLKKSAEVIVENGGDIFLSTKKERLVAIFAGNSPLSGKIALKISPGEVGVCTSSGTVGHSLSFGKSDAVVVISPDTLLADAAATALGNRVRSEEDVEEALHFAQEVPGVKGVVVVKGEKLGAWGEVEIVPI